MIDILKIVLIFTFILLLLRKKLGVGYVLIAASALLSMAYLMKPAEVLDTISNTVTSKITFELFIALTFIRMLEIILREEDILHDMMVAMKGLIRRRRWVVISMPLLIGLLPSIGGAYFSAPMVEEATKDMGLSREDKAFTNYWYRHPWEFILPLYPGIILAAALTGKGLRAFILHNLSYSVTMLIIGGFFAMKGIKGKGSKENGLTKKGLISFSPIIILLLLVMIFHIPVHYALVFVVAALLALFRYDYERLKKVFKYGFSPDIVFLILGVMLFKETLVTSGAVKNLTIFFEATGIPIFPILFLLPFVCGLLTGLTVGSIGATFPLIISIYGTNMAGMSFAFAAGYVGVLLSPVHVCLILTTKYFEANMWKIYKKLIPATLSIMGVALIQYLFLTLR